MEYVIEVVILLFLTAGGDAQKKKRNMPTYFPPSLTADHPPPSLTSHVSLSSSVSAIPKLNESPQTDSNELSSEEAIGMLFSAVNGIQRNGAGSEQIKLLQERVHMIQGMLNGYSPNKIQVETRSIGVQANTAPASPPTIISTSEAEGSPLSSSTKTSRRRIKINHKHPILLPLHCSSCDCRMTPKTWGDLTTRIKRQVIWAQADVDSYAKQKKTEVQEYIKDSCQQCKDQKNITLSSKKLPQSSRDLTLRKNVSENEEVITMKVESMPQHLRNVEKERADDDVLNLIKNLDQNPPAQSEEQNSSFVWSNQSIIESTKSVVKQVVPPSVALRDFSKSGKDLECNPTMDQLQLRPEWSAGVTTACGFTGCPIRFNFFQRKHHCRVCGYIFCDNHTKDRVCVPDLGYDTPQRVCTTCVSQLPP